ncbi:MAG: phosphoenolpyruvate--protein phosphotransferase [Proteobacteria bacterium]|nr:phosphoenolpyruvate--protein phosphotransferase [Cystobacterineae bacterium]MCL2259441.1 phosphoenolpyruvate--protein phosphotransferase [Cystobacterineae bacterium]MCL2314211.1 phosphoenolpyruvate--protein phosphotransferase [Pseudomonadota bacterium]
MSQNIFLKGIAASPGVAIGQAFVCTLQTIVPTRRELPPTQLEAEVSRLYEALKTTEGQLAHLRKKLPADEHGLILEAHSLMLEDPLFVDAAVNTIREEAVNAEWAVFEVTQALLSRFDTMQNAYIRERRADVKWVSDRVQKNLDGQVFDEEEDTFTVPENSVVVADELPVAKAVFLANEKNALAFVTQGGGQTSHTSIVARAKQLPAVVGIPTLLQRIKPGDCLIVDGGLGEVCIQPDEAALVQAKLKQQQWHAQQIQAQHRAHAPAVSLDGHRVSLWGNMEFVEEVDTLLQMGAEGVGLFRTEFLLVGRDNPCSEEEQFWAYRRVLEAMQGRLVTLRTFDLGGDKLSGDSLEKFLGEPLEKEANPALGLRAIRLCLSHRELFRAQLRAALRASAYGNLQIMFPLISHMSEFYEAKRELEECRSSLSLQGIAVAKNIPVGIMVETPAAAWIADRLALEADFFSIGTNDLIQYTLAIDRQNSQVAYLYHPLHLSVLRSLRHVINAARNANIPLSVCGEIAGTPKYIAMLLGLGIRSLSMAAIQLGKAKESVQNTSLAQTQRMMETVLEKSSTEEIDAFIEAQTNAMYAHLKP